MPRPIHRPLCAALAVALLAGCMGGLPGKVEPGAALRTAPTIAPSATATARQGLSIERWWVLFGDPALDRLMDEMLAHNEDLESAVARVREAQASLDQVRAAQLPTLDLNASGSRSQQSEVGAMPLPRGVDRKASTYRVTVDAAYELDLWGKLSSSTDAARQQLLSTEWAHLSIEWSLTARLAESYFGLAAVDRQIEISESVRAVRAATLQARQREHAVGAGNEFDLRRAEAELTGTEATLANLARQRASLERAVTALLGRTPAEIATGDLQRSAIDERKALTAVLPQGAAADLLVRRPDIRQAEAQLAAANWSIEAARAATLPSVRLSGSLGSDAKSISNLFSGPALIWTIAASVFQPLFDGGKAKARVHEEHARAEQSLASYRKVVAGAVLDVREAYASLDTTHEGVRAQRERVASLARARELAKLGYENGALSYLDLLDAERNWYQAQLDQVGSYRDQLTSQVAAFKALGGGYAAPRDPDQKESSDMKSTPSQRRILFACIGAIGLGAGAIALFGREGAAAQVPKKPVPSITVNVVEPSSTTFARQIAATGTISPRDELLIGSDASGVRLTEVLVDVGSAVRKGQLLARADDAQLRAQLAQMVAQVKQAEAESAQADANLERAERLKDSGVYSLETVQTRRTSAASASAKLELAIAQRHELEIKVGHTRVYAPYAGVISKRTATVGAVVQQGNELFRLIKDGQLEWRAELPSHSLARISEGASARILLDDGRAIEASVRLVAPTIDASTRNGQVHVALPRGAALKAGGHARGEILINNAQALAVPESSVLTRDGYPYVYTVGADHVARLTKIETGARQQGLVEVSAGLRAEARVIGTGAGFVKDGDLVRVAPMTAQRAAQGGKS